MDNNKKTAQALINIRSGDSQLIIVPASDLRAIYANVYYIDRNGNIAEYDAYDFTKDLIDYIVKNLDISPIYIDMDI